WLHLDSASCPWRATLRPCHPRRVWRSCDSGRWMFGGPWCPGVLACYHFRLNCGPAKELGRFLFQRVSMDGGGLLRTLYADSHHTRRGDRPAVFYKKIEMLSTFDEPGLQNVAGRGSRAVLWMT